MTVIDDVPARPISYYLGSLKDLGLGSPNGIPSGLATADDTERIAYGERLLDTLAAVTDFKHYACIDGRNCTHNADGSAPQIRRRQVGGTGLLVEVAMNGGAPVIDTIPADSDLTAVLDLIEKDYAGKTGVMPSAHLGGCGGVNGAIEDNDGLDSDQASLNVAKVLMEHPAVHNYSGLDYDESSAAKVRESAVKSTEFLKSKGWDGQAYVEHAKMVDPAGVEDLEVDTEDHTFHGHKEQAVVFVLSKDGTQSISEHKLKELGLGEDFIVNIDASVDMAKALAGDREDEGATQSLIANLAKHARVAKRLPRFDTPVYLLVA